MSMTVSPKQLRSLAAACFAAREPILIKGAPGVGKTDILGLAAADAEHDIILSHPVTSDPTDAKGLPWKGEGDEATFLPFGDLAQAIRATKPTVWFLDDLGQASAAVQASYMQLVLARRVNGHRLPDCVTFAAATNRRADRAGVQGILEPVKSRFTIFELETTLDDWREWALEHDMPASLIGFLSARPELLSKFEATQDITNSPCPRNWAGVGRLQATVPDAVRLQAFAGRVGEADAVSYMGFLEMLEKAPDPDAILMDPDGARLPDLEEPGIAYAVALALSYRATAKNFGSIAIYAKRMYEASMPEFSTLMLRDSVRRDQAITSTKVFQALAGSQMAKSIFEAFTEDK